MPQIPSGFGQNRGILFLAEDSNLIAGWFGSFFLCCLPFLLFNQSVFVSFVAFCVKDNWAVHDVGIEVGS